ncbi:MAG TPA: hypothetical protein VEJ18_03280, partial [Planctomycetota bacterium]|nr:hypothetical protein [Planctomycetota bacterium]
GDWPAAVAALEKAVALQPGNLGWRRALRRARLAAGKFDDLEKELEEARKGRILPYETAEDLALLRAMQGKRAEALALAERGATPLRGLVEDDDLDAVLLGVKAAALYAAADFQALSALGGEDEDEVPFQRAHGYLELGKVDEALEILEEPDELTLLAVALLRPDDDGAARRAADKLESDDADAAPLAKALRSGAAGDVDAALDANVDGRLKAPALALLARRIPARAADLRAQAARLNTIPVFPHHLVKRALAQ